MKRPTVRPLVVGFVAPAIITLAAVGVGLTWLGELPDATAIHWNGAGQPDGFSTPLAFLLQLGGLSIALAAIVTAIVVSTAERGFTAKQKLLLLVSPFISTMLMTITLQSLDAQRGLADASAAPSPVGAVLLGGLLGLVAAALGWFVLPKSLPAEVTDATTPAATALGNGDRVLWVRSLSSPRWLVAIVAGAALVIVVTAIITPGMSAPLWAIAIPAAALMLATLFWRVRVDNAGVVIRSFAGVPRFTITLPDIATATVPVINPLVEFGGWGVRLGAGRRVGVILNRGEALEVHRTDGSSIVVTVDDAAGAASLINGLVARARLGA